MANPASASLLLRQYKEMTDPRKGIPSFHITLDGNDIYNWSVGVMVLSDDSPYHGGYFRGHMMFPIDYPFSPPTFQFTPAIFHPNVYKDGKLCISILHKSGDETSGEPDSETWSPAQSVESVLISIVSMLSDPNISSPANVDAAVLWKNDRSAYNRRVAQDVTASKHNIPAGFTMPQAEKAYVSRTTYSGKEDVIDEDFWYESADSADEDENIMGDDDDDDPVAHGNGDGDYEDEFGVSGSDSDNVNPDYVEIDDE